MANVVVAEEEKVGVGMANVVVAEQEEKIGVGLIRIADLPADVQAVIQKLKLDKDGDGTLCADELGVAFKDCTLLLCE